MDFSQFWFQSGDVAFSIPSSLRFGKDQYLEKDFGTAISANSTLSIWFKIGDRTLNSNNLMILTSFESADESDYQTITINTNDLLEFTDNHSSNVDSVGVLRDPSAWYHLVVHINTNNAWLNGNAIELSSTNLLMPNVGSSTKMKFGIRRTTRGEWWQGYQTEIHFIEGQHVQPTTFGEFNSDGVWVPIQVSGVTYGTKGFHLACSSSANLGADSSGNSNNFTVVGFDTTSTSVGYDFVLDSPSKNWTTMNPIAVPNAAIELNTYDDGNLMVEDANNTGQGRVISPATQYIGVDDTGTFYAEATFAQDDWYMGIVSSKSNLNDFTDNNGLNDGLNTGLSSDNNRAQIRGDRHNNFWSGTTAGTFSILYDNDTRRVQFYRDGVLLTYGANTDPDLDTNSALLIPEEWGMVTFYIVQKGNTSDGINFGQKPFQYTLGGKPLASMTHQATSISDGSAHFKTVIDTGANIRTSAQAAFSDGLWWIKDRDNSNSHQLVDSIRGISQARRSPQGDITSYSTPSGESVAWCWSAPDSFTDNSADIPSTGRRNVAAGFSIRKYDGSNVSGDSIKHGLGKTPDFMIVFAEENRDSGVWHSSFPDDRFKIESSSSASNASTCWNRDPNDTDIFFSDANISNGLGKTYTTYVWTAIPGYSAFGTYTGNGTSTLNEYPFVYLGFKPALVLIKVNNTGSWYAFDSTISTINPVGQYLRPNASANETNFDSMDFLSNGFKIRTNDIILNEYGKSYMYCAWAENPFEAPTTAR